MNEFVTWEALGSYAGAVMMVTLITQLLKGTPLDAGTASWWPILWRRRCWWAPRPQTAAP